MMSWRALAGVLSLSCLLVGAATAAERRANPQVQAWLNQMEAIDELLRVEEWKKARRKSDALVRDFSRRLITRGSELMGTALLQRAIALEAMGEREDALWDTFAADTLSVRVRALLALHGTRGAALLEALTEEPEEPELDVVAESGLGLIALPSSLDGNDGVSRETADILTPGGDVLPPEKRSGRDPQYPESTRQARIEGFIIVHTIVDKQGRPGRPRIVKGGAHPVLVLNALEAMKGWRFKPAELDGEPVDVHYTLTVNFELRG